MLVQYLYVCQLSVDCASCCVWCHFGILWAHNSICQWIDTSLATGGAHTRTEQRDRGGHPSIKISAINASSVEWLMGLVPGRAHVCGRHGVANIFPTGDIRLAQWWKLLHDLTCAYSYSFSLLKKIRDDCLSALVQENLHPPQRRRNGGLCLDFLHFHADAHLVWSMGYVCLHATVNLMTFPILCVQDRSCFFFFFVNYFGPFKFPLLFHRHISKLGGTE